MFSQKLEKLFTSEIKELTSFLHKSSEVKKIAYICFELKNLFDTVEDALKIGKIKLRTYALENKGNRVNILKNKSGSVYVVKKSDTEKVDEKNIPNLHKVLKDKFYSYFQTKYELRKNYKKLLDKEDVSTRMFIESNLQKKKITPHVYIKKTNPLKIYFSGKYIYKIFLELVSKLIHQMLCIFPSVFCVKIFQTMYYCI